MNCHTAEGLGPCHETTLYKDWRCKELQAKLYVNFVDNPTCLGDLQKHHPTFAEYHEMCLEAVMRIGFNVVVIVLMSVSFVTV